MAVNIGKSIEDSIRILYKLSSLLYTSILISLLITVKYCTFPLLTTLGVKKICLLLTNYDFTGTVNALKLLKTNGNLLSEGASTI